MEASRASLMEELGAGGRAALAAASDDWEASLFVTEDSWTTSTVWHIEFA